ncbi:pentatricopeptide repeat-containing protein At3g09040, mitochondrial [Selaginella moellendorffii]|uniref:pentatricopeptide repeat-containing protein At3g09040, mitochondrial n=1 Tax=Selaginella moellendorffii TaxID=88036 RepID=UPI000D1CB908|nr:pentatricopeptide repeat-containing protein At3g09040, mitochondrial [Selaginella moellendorffii]|eukprot:XP_024517773.1 pentatricopeptide repeat-containing protein At3g09040, mitochondrial [Selaginella moellendorffii]
MEDFQRQREDLARGFQACGDEGSADALAQGKFLHSQAARLGLDRDELLAKNIVHMYLRCGSIPGARQVFDNLHDRDVILWTAMITAYARNGDFQQGMALLRAMLLDGVAPNKITILAALGTTDCVVEARSIHRILAVESGLEWDVSVGTAIVSMYCRCGSLEDAIDHFEQMPVKNVVTWSVAMAGCKELHRPELGLEIFRGMLLEGAAVDKITLVTLLDLCSSCEDVVVGGEILPDDLLERFGEEIETNVIVGTALVNLYAKGGDLERACGVFSRMKNRNVVTWTALITAHCCCNRDEQALEIFRQMQLEGVRPNAVVFVNVLNACCSMPAAGRTVLELVLECGAERDAILGNAIVNMLGKSGLLDEAREFFERLKSSAATRKNLVLWNGMLAAYALQGEFPAAMEVFAGMLLEGAKPNQATYASVLLHSRRALKSVTSQRHLKLLRLCAEETGLGEAIAGLSTLDHGCEHDDRGRSPRGVVWWTALIVESAEDGRYSDCLEHFGTMQLHGVKPNAVTLANVLYVLGLDRGKLLHGVMVDSGVAVDVGVGTALMNLYARSKLPEHGHRVFLEMEEHTTVSWTAMIACFAQNSRNAEALGLYRRMHLEGHRADAKTFTTILLACSSLIALPEVRSIHSCVHESGFHINDAVSTTLMSAYGKCGTLEDASRIFLHSSSTNPLNTSRWSSMIATSARHGCAAEAVAIFHLMQQEGARADDVTLLCVLAACSHGGMTAKAVEFFVSMIHDYKVGRTGDHCSCMADLLGRNGRLEDAEELIRKMPFQAAASVWMTLLGACRTHGDLPRAKEASDQVSGINPEHAQSYIVLSNVYAESGTKQDHRCSRTSCLAQ